MSSTITYGVPLAILALLGLFSAILFPWQASSTNDRGKETKEHSERIYKDFDMYLKVALGLSAAFGYIRFEKMKDAAELGRQGLQVVGGLALFVMVIFCIFVICHMGSKIRRWQNIEWGKALFWQETWAVLAMWFFSSAIWVAANIW
jgi:hypothetical protein